MQRLNPDKLHVTIASGITSEYKNLPRRYTLTHSDWTGNLFLTIGNDYDKKQISGLYTRLMRDEVLAELVRGGDNLELRVYCHISGGPVIGTAGWRNSIFHRELRLALEAIRYGDRTLFETDQKLDHTPVKVHFLSADKRYHKVESWGVMAEYK